MSELTLSNINVHLEALQIVAERAFAERDRHVAEFMHRYFLKGLLRPAMLSEFYDEMERKYGRLPKTPNVPPTPPKPVTNGYRDGDGGAVVPRPIPPKPLPSGGSTIPFASLIK